MGLFSIRKTSNDYVAICMNQDGLYSAFVKKEFASQPSVEFVSFYPRVANHTYKFLLERLNKEMAIRDKKCLLSIERLDYQLHSIEALNIPSDERRAALRFKLKEVLDYSIEDAFYDWFDIESYDQGQQRLHSHFVFTAQKKILKGFVNDIHKARLQIDVIDTYDMAQRNFSVLMEDGSHGLAMFSCDKNGGLLTITYQGELYLSRRLDISLKELQSAQPEETQYVFERLSLELQRTIDNFERQYSHITTSKLVLAPIGEVGEELRTYLMNALYVPVVSLDMANLLNLSKVVDLHNQEKQNQFFHVIGAALRNLDNAQLAEVA